ncbi:MAG: AraC family transcriptional regulator [Pseudomonadota bacterium]
MVSASIGLATVSSAKPPAMPWWPKGEQPFLFLCWALFSVSIAAFVLHQSFLFDVPILGVLLTLVGLIPCGWAWMFARALFREGAHRDLWPWLIIATFYASCVVLYFDGSGSQSGALGYLRQIQGLMASAMLIMTFVETIDGIRRDQAHRKFRLIVAIGFLSTMAASLVVDLPEFAAVQDQTRTALATIALCGATAAFQHRRRILTARANEAAEATAARARPEIAKRLTALLEQDRVFLDPDLKVADIAQRLRQPDYKVTQCITGDLGYGNFNQMINAYRVDEAEALLVDPALSGQSILDVAMACGFGSLGPFNRAFKAKTGMTPSQFKRVHATVAVTS